MKQPFTSTLPGDRLGTAIAGRLSDACTNLDHDIAERLRVARQQAVARRKVAEVAVGVSAVGAVRPGRAAALQLGGRDEPGLWARLGAMLPLLALVGGLLAIYVVQNDNRASELAEVDEALLTDDLPTAAYTDPGFLQFLKTGASAPQD
ncbi:DUF3619 family protein [Pseudorhodoferax sp.]|uniref:DUF3619 family protein n=1 Tax=Pseudorhodoferax sp. TaxID=1993553 RepID=UPI002DD61DFE|nr:DUF3619 family protein [Pseudorhodoferax sp.]